MPPVENSTSFFRPFLAVLLPGLPPEAAHTETLDYKWSCTLATMYSPFCAANTETDAENRASLKAF